MAKSYRASEAFSLPASRLGVPLRIAAVVFDFDGTLTKPDAIDFPAIHKVVGCPDGVGLLEFLEAIDDRDARLSKEGVLIDAEMKAAERCQVNEGARELIAEIRKAQIPMAVITRNRREAVERALLNLEDICEDDFECLVTRDLPLSPKPSPEAVVHVAEELDVTVGELLLVGDHLYDIEAGARAGALTMFLTNGKDEGREKEALQSDFVVSDLREALDIIRYGLPLPVGKLPSALLEEGLEGLTVDDPSVLFGAAVGEDAAAVQVGGAEVLVLASDPITLASDSMARYLVMANANDVATSGVEPRWFLATLLFPRGTSPAEVLSFLRGLDAVCAEVGLTLVGGHTEVTDAVSRLVAVGTVAGSGERSRLLDKRQMREGDHLLMTKGVAVEGTGLLAREFGSRLMKAGITAAEVTECSAFLDRIGVLEEARIARGFSGVTALHDVTEGGLAAAVRELGDAGGHRLCVYMERIRIYSETTRLCEALCLAPLGLIGSGSLLITCSTEDMPRLLQALGEEGIEVADIGEVLEEGEGVEALFDGDSAEWPVFERDEIARLQGL